MLSVRVGALAFAAVLAVSWGSEIVRGQTSTVPPTGLRTRMHGSHSLVGGRVVAAPGQVLEKATVVVRDGVIVAVGDVPVPADARIWDMTGKTLYAGFIDAYAEVALEESRRSAATGAPHWNRHVTPQVEVGANFSPPADLDKTLRGQGVAVRLVAPADGVIKGASALATTGAGGGERVLLKSPVALHAMLTVPGGPSENREFPSSPMGALTLLRQTLYDARWYEQAWLAWSNDPALPRPERNDALAAINRLLQGGAPVVIDAADEWYFLRADQIGREFDLNAIIRGSGREYRRLEAVAATGRGVIVPVNFPLPPDVTTAEAAAAAPLERLLHWDLAPENPGRLVAAGVKIAFTTHGLKDAGGFLAGVRKAVQRGLAPEAALAALTLAPAEFYGVQDRLGSLEAGKAAHLVVADGNLFDAKTKILETWVDGQRYEVETAPSRDIRGAWELAILRADGGSETLTVELGGSPLRLEGQAVRGDKRTPLVRPALDASQLTASFKGNDLGWTGVVQLSATLLAADRSGAAAAWLGTLRWSDGATSAVRGKLLDVAPAKPESAPAAGEAPAAPALPDAPVTALYPVRFPLNSYGVLQTPPQPEVVAFRHATVWTSGPAGILPDATVLAQAGKILAVGADVAVPEGATEVDCRGWHLSPGMIDCHSHIATDGGVNEPSQSITAEVRIGDFIDANDIAIYRQLGGGVTSSNILHGSANTIGGQNQVIKLRWGALPEEMKFARAPAGIKFALGENVKQSNWGERFTTRYPQSRMGVEQVVRDAFRAARDYRRRWEAWNAAPAGLPPRRDLELEALSEVLAGQRLVHCHSYRQDEIVAFLRACEDFGVRVATLQHILEGYKVADVIARHGAGGSSFSDWWAYKFEVIDAIPYNGALLHQAGVVVSFNSDDAELARHLNLEAAKAVKYGGVTPEEALKFVTLNPARQLGIDALTGSIEPGKDADLALWSGSPLSSYSRCEQTWIDGRKYFDRQDDAARQREAQSMRAALVQRALASGEPPGPPDDGSPRWPREDLFCPHHSHGQVGHEHREEGGRE